MSTAARLLPPDYPAPWAEIVPDMPPMTIDDFLDYPAGDDGYRYELVEGILVRMVGTRPRAGRINRRLYDQLAPFVRAHGLGTVTQPDEVYDFENSGQKDTGLLPDIGFYYAWRESLIDPDKAYPFAPDLAIEVTSPRQSGRAMQAKAARYLRGGTALVWVVWPKRQQVDVWHPGDIEPTIVSVADSLNGENVIPGFTYPVAALFA